MSKCLFSSAWVLKKLELERTGCILYVECQPSLTHRRALPRREESQVGTLTFRAISLCSREVRSLCLAGVAVRIHSALPGNYRKSRRCAGTSRWKRARTSDFIFPSFVAPVTPDGFSVALSGRPATEGHAEKKLLAANPQPLGKPSRMVCVEKASRLEVWRLSCGTSFAFAAVQERKVRGPCKPGWIRK